MLIATATIGKVFSKIMLRIPNGDDVQYDNMKQPYKDEEEFIERLQNAIWPNTDPEGFAALLEEGGKECLEMRYGQRQETCLHRYKNDPLI